VALGAQREDGPVTTHLFTAADGTVGKTEIFARSPEPARSEYENKVDLAGLAISA